MLPLEISSELNTVRLQAVVDFLALSEGVATLYLFGDDRPLPGGAPVASALAAIPLFEPAGAVVDGFLIITLPPGALVTASGQVTWLRLINGAGTWAFDCNVTDEDGPGPAKMPSRTLYAGGFVNPLLIVLG
jgi:hypothetical protein